MAEQDDATKTEEPTARRMATARGDGHVAQSQEIRSWMILLGGSAGLLLMAPWMSSNISAISARFIETPDTISVDMEHLRLVMVDALLELGLVMAPLMGLLLVMAFASSIGQFGFLYAPKKIRPKLSNISVLSGVKRMFSMPAVVEFLKGLIKLTVVAAIAFSMTAPHPCHRHPSDSGYAGSNDGDRGAGLSLSEVHLHEATADEPSGSPR